jgi:DNA phosphorothioation-dependent restriction protein DptH
MDTTLTMTSLKIDLLARAILARLQGVAPGHCARVDFLTQDEAAEVCERMQIDAASSLLVARVLSHHEGNASAVCINADKAIEIRNRKEYALCLFVPSNLVDAAVSSLANSFEVIDARDLYKTALDQLLGRLDAGTAQRVRSTLGRVRNLPQVDDAQRLDFAAAVEERQQAHDLDHAGLELWRVGLVADDGADFVARLDKNRECARKLTRPSKLQAMPAERISDTGVDATTASKLLEFFRSRPMNDIAAWSRTLAQQGDLTFDRWQFIQEERSDLREVVVRPFMDAKGKVERWCKLKQQGEEGALLAEYGPKGSVVVRWSTQPLEPRNLRGWRLEIVPAGGDEDDIVADLPVREVPASRREATLKLDIEPEEQIDYAVCVRVTPLDAAKNDIRKVESGRSLAAVSDEFYLVPQGEPPTTTSRETRRGEPNIPFGRLSYLLSTAESELNEGEPQWANANDGAFRLKLNTKHEIRIEISSALLALERRLIKDPRGVYSFVARVSDVEPLTADQIEAMSAPAFDSEVWQGFWNARATFFGKVAKSHPRDTIEVLDWTADLAGSALRYSRAYARLLEDLTQPGAPREELLTALGVDSLLIQMDTGHGSEESLITLPTHPMRAVWLASYAQLLREWEKRIVERGSGSRRSACDLDLLRLITPANTPAFVAHPATDNAFVFFQDLQFFYGIALPAQITEPQRRLDDIAVQLGVDTHQAAEDEPSAARLAQYLERFLDTHPYTTTLTMTTINPDRGELLAEALRRYLEHKVAEVGEDDEASDLQLPRLDVTAYAERPERGALQALEAVRRSQALRLASMVDERHPALAVTVCERSTLNHIPPQDAHLALVADLTQPAIRAVTTPSAAQPGASSGASFSLYGLVTRLVSSLSITGATVVCRYTISANSTGKGQQHPVTGFTDALVDIHTAQLAACAVAFGGSADQTPALEVTLDGEQQRLLAQLHQRTNWVVTSDRHFALEYYDSPQTPQLAELAETYVLDYAPEFTEGMGRRMIATTSWRDEVTIVLRRAMEDLGLRAVERSVRQALQTLKTVSGGLALQTLFSSSSAAAAAGLAIVTSLLKSQGRLRQAILIPVDLHPSLFTLSGATNARGERRCDLVLVGLRRGIVEATCIEVKWRRGNAPLDDLIPDMLNQMEGTALAMHARFFEDARARRVDGALQRAHLANALRFYFERASRYGLLAMDTQAQFLEHLSRLEKSGLDFRFAYEGYIVNLDGEPHKPIPVPDGKIIILTGTDLDTTPEFGQSDSWTERHGNDSTAESDVPPVSGALVGEMDHERLARPADDVDDTEHGENLAAPPTPHVVASEPMVVSEEPLSVSEEPRMADQAQATEEATRAADRTPLQVSVALGEAHGEIVRWEPSVKGSPHLFISGIPGQGKSWTTLRLLTELGRQGVPALTLDFHGQFAESGNAYIEIAHPTILDAAQGLPFSPFDLSSGADTVSWRAASYELAEIFGYVAGLGEIQQDVIRTAIRNAYVAHGFDQPGDDEEVSLPTLTDVLRHLERLETTRRTANVLARCRPLLEMELFRPQPDTPDLITLARAGLIIDLHHLYAESVQLAAGAFVLRKVYRDMFHWGVADRLRLAIVLDEAHRLAKDVTLPKIMKEGRKFGVCVIVASQGMGDFHPDILGNAGAKVIFRTNYPDSRKIAGFIRTRPGFDFAQRIEQLTVGSAFVQTPEMPLGTLVTMFAPDDERC